MMLLARAPGAQHLVRRISANNYAAPVIALHLSTILLHEPLTFMKLASGALALGAR